MDLKKSILEEFVEKMPAIRKSLKLSQTELGEKLGLSRQSISSIERKIVPLTWDTFLAISLVIMVNDPNVLKKLDHPERYKQVIESLKTESKNTLLKEDLYV